jgi:hypothetical protein
MRGKDDRSEVFFRHRLRASFSKFARSVLRHISLVMTIGVASKQELKERITAGIKDVNRYPVIHTWSYKLAEAA